MISRYYLLCLEELFSETDGERLLKRTLCKIDSARRKKAEGLQSLKARAACAGAGLLLQIALQEALEAGAEGSGALISYSVSQALGLVKKTLEPVMDYGEKGKPYLREYPWFFNLSHSGAYVFCAVSDREVGADIQQCAAADLEKLAQRFFSERENHALTACRSEEERRQLFFRLWTRKEACGKLSGEGIFGAVSVNLLPCEDEAGVSGGYCWKEWDLRGEYRIAVCQRAYV